MTINKFTFSYSRSVSMRRYESVSVFLSAEVQIEEGEKFSTAVFNAKKQIRAEVEEEVTRLKKERQESRDDELERSE